MALGTVIRSFAAPAAFPTGVAWDGRALWHCDVASDLVYQLDPVTGTTLRSFASPVGNPTGIEWDGFNLYVAGSGSVYVVDPVTGTLIRTIAALGGPRSVAFDGRFLWITEDNTNTIIQYDQVRDTSIRSFASPSTTPSGIAWDGRGLWISDINITEIILVDPVTGTVITSVASPGGSPRDLTWDGRTLWHTDNATQLIYQIAVT